MARVLLNDPHEQTPPPRRKKRPSWLPTLYRDGKFYKVDGRSREGILLRDTNNSLLEQLNRKPTPAEKLLIERLSWLHLCIQTLDRRVLQGTVDYAEAAQYATHINSFSQGLANLGLLGSALELPTLNDATTTSHPSTQNASARASAALRKRESVSVDE